LSAAEIHRLSYGGQHDSDPHQSEALARRVRADRAQADQILRRDQSRAHDAADQADREIECLARARTVGHQCSTNERQERCTNKAARAAARRCACNRVGVLIVGHDVEPKLPTEPAGTDDTTRAEIATIRPPRWIVDRLHAVGLRVELKHFGRIVIPVVSFDREDTGDGA
jgi:hypothetical protein